MLLFRFRSATKGSHIRGLPAILFRSWTMALIVMLNVIECRLHSTALCGACHTIIDYIGQRQDQRQETLPLPQHSKIRELSTRLKSHILTVLIVSAYKVCMV